jgi:hypothetical protein
VLGASEIAVTSRSALSDEPAAHEAKCHLVLEDRRSSGQQPDGEGRGHEDREGKQ